MLLGNVPINIIALSQIVKFPGATVELINNSFVWTRSSKTLYFDLNKAGLYVLRQNKNVKKNVVLTMNNPKSTSSSTIYASSD